MNVADTDLTTYFWIEQTRSETARRVRSRDSEWAAPRVWRSEFRNILRKYINSEHLSYSEALWYAEKAEQDLRGAEHKMETPDVLKLVERTGHPAYDCQYVALARATGVTLVTDEPSLVAAFPPYRGVDGRLR